MRNKKFIICILVIVLLSFSLISCTTTTKTKTAAIENETVEYKLATLYAGSPVEKDDLTVYQFKELLDKLEKKTVNSRIDIADIAVTAQRLLKEYGISRTSLQILTDFNESIPETLKDIKLEEIASAYMVLMTK